jgi:hypothetical protein
MMEDITMTKRPTTQTPPRNSPEKEASVSVDSTDLVYRSEAQVEQDLELAKGGSGMVDNPRALMNELIELSSPDASSDSYDPIENAMQRHPGLLREEAEEMAKAFGF